MELETPEFEFVPQKDERARMTEPLPVRLVAVADVRLPAPVGAEQAIDAFYSGLWQFERLPGEPGLVYRAENFRVHFELMEGLIERDTLRPLIVEVRSLADAERKLIEMEMEYQRQKGLTPGTHSLLLLDPAGNWVELVERREIR